MSKEGFRLLPGKKVFPLVATFFENRQTVENKTSFENHFEFCFYSFSTLEIDEKTARAKFDKDCAEQLELLIPQKEAFSFVILPEIQERVYFTANEEAHKPSENTFHCYMEEKDYKKGPIERSIRLYMRIKCDFDWNPLLKNTVRRFGPSLTIEDGVFDFDILESAYA